MAREERRMHCVRIYKRKKPGTGKKKKIDNMNRGGKQSNRNTANKISKERRIISGKESKREERRNPQENVCGGKKKIGAFQAFSSEAMAAKGFLRNLKWLVQGKRRLTAPGE